MKNRLGVVLFSLCFLFGLGPCYLGFLAWTRGPGRITRCAGERWNRLGVPHYVSRENAKSDPLGIHKQHLPRPWPMNCCRVPRVSEDFVPLARASGVRV